MSTLEFENRLTFRLPRRMAVLGLACGILSAAPLRAQDDVAQAARQERERKAAQQNAPRHVYTDEDLKRNKIITPEDESRAISRKTTPPAPEKKDAEPQVAEHQQQPTESLGEVARRYRQEKAARLAEQARNHAPSRYPLELPNASLAAPKPEVAPESGSLRADELRPAPPKFSPAPKNLFPSRISPFVPRDPMVSRSPSANVPLAVLASSVHREKVLPGDSWWKLASRYLGRGSRWGELLRVNPGLSRDTNKLAAGTLVFVPQSVRVRPAPPGVQIVVHKGDTLWSLAREHLGCGQMWTQLAAANPEITQFNKLQIGASLKLPAKQSPACTLHHTPALRD